MKEVLSIVTGAVFTIGVSIALGSMLLRALRLTFHRVEWALFAFAAGSGILSSLVMALCFAHQARRGVFQWGGLGVIATGAVLARRRSRRTLPAVRLDWLIPFAIVGSVFFVYYLFNALAPEVSPDGSGYHLGNVARMWRHHGFDWGYRSMYTYLSQGAEMLYLFAFTFGRHSAAAMVHFAFLCTLPLLMVCYGRRFGLARASLFAAIVVFASPVMAKDGVSAYNDLVIVTLIYAVFYLLEVWNEKRSDNLLILVGLLSGFAYAVKYTAALVVPFVLFWIWRYRGLRISAVIRFLIPVAILATPWLMRNWWWTGNPLAPFANAWFPNPYHHTGMERQYVEMLSHYPGIKHWWQIPLELTLRGTITGGTLNPVILMLPLSLLALRVAEGRKLLLAALVFAVPAWFNVGARFLIPSIPFAAMALGIALETIPLAMPAAVLFTILAGWPATVTAYADQWNWRIAGFPKAEALRRQPVEGFILKYLPDYALKPVIEQNVPKGERLFSFAGRPDAYIDRDIVVSYESSLGTLVQDSLWAPQSHAPRTAVRFRFLPVTTRQVRVVNNERSRNYWTIAEMRVFSKGKEVVRDPRWQIEASPNPWEAGLAFDNNYATRWSTWEGMAPHAHLGIAFPGPVEIDEVVLQCEYALEAKLQIDILLPSGRWVGVTDTPEPVKSEPPSGIRRAATAEVKSLGFRYLLVNDDDYLYQDLKKNPGFWGMTQIAEVHGTHLYRID